MTHSIKRTLRRWARVSHAGRDGITVGTIRAFLIEVEEAGIDDSAPVRIKDDLGEGANRSGYIEASIEQEDTRPLA